MELDDDLEISTNITIWWHIGNRTFSPYESSFRPMAFVSEKVVHGEVEVALKVLWFVLTIALAHLGAFCVLDFSGVRCCLVFGLWGIEFTLPKWFRG